VLELAADTVGLAASLGLWLRLRLLLSGGETRDEAEVRRRRSGFARCRKRRIIRGSSRVVGRGRAVGTTAAT